MPIWTNAPPATNTGPALRIVRTPTSGQLTAAITCPDLVGCATHYYQHRTIPCEPPNCPACADGIGWRWHGWVSAILSSTTEHILFEFTATAAEYFRSYRDTYNTLRGCVFTAGRVNNRPNARVIIRTKAHDPTKIHLPEAPDMIAALTHIWGLPPEQANQNGRIKGHPAISINRNKPITSTTE